MGEATAEEDEALVHQILSLHPLLKASQPQQGREGHTAGEVWPKVSFKCLQLFSNSQAKKLTELSAS